MIHSDQKSVLQIIKYFELVFSAGIILHWVNYNSLQGSIGNICFPYLASYKQLTFEIKNENLIVCAACIAITQVGKIKTHFGNIVLIGNPSFQKIRKMGCILIVCELLQETTP